jgi:twitching motility two-component system response regulator PilG
MMEKQANTHQTTKPWCRLFHIGLEVRETLVIESALRSSPELGKRYLFGPPTDDDPVDVVFVNGDDADAVATWSQLHQQRPELTAIVIASGDADFGAAKVVRRPLDLRNFVGILDAITSTDMHALDHSETTGAIKVLVCDDSFPARQYMKLKLEEIAAAARIDIDVDLVDCGEKALEAAQERCYDVAFLDVVMPGIDGYEVCARLKALRPMRVAMLTGRTTSVDFSRGRSAGCDNYLSKPANDADLRTIIQLTALKKMTATAPRALARSS